MTDHHDDTDRRRYLEALDDLRAERDDLHPHRPVLDPPARHLHAVPTERGLDPTDTRTIRDQPPLAPLGRFLTDDEIERGRRHLAELRAQLACMNPPARKDLPA